MHLNLWKVTLRHYTRHPLQILLSILGVSLGVAVVVAIDLANSSADKAFTLSSEAMTGKATHQIVGGAEGLPDRLFVHHRIKAGFQQSTPVVEGYGNLLSHDKNKTLKTLRIVGIDVFSEKMFRDHLQKTETKLDLERFIAGGNTAILLNSTAKKYGLGMNREFDLQVLGVRHTFTIIGLIEAENDLDSLGLESMLFMDIATAQEILGMQGQLSRIDLILPDHSAAQLSRQIEKRLPPNSVIVGAQARYFALKEMTSAFQLNLYALSLLALLVGIFLIYNTMTFSVVQRRDILGYLRTLGVTRQQIFTLIAVEAAVVGLFATSFGIGLGILLGTVLLHLVTQTINDLYFVLAINELNISTLSIVKGVLIGMLGTMLAVIKPAYDATKSTPRSAFSRSQYEGNYKRTIRWTFFLGLPIGLVGVGLLAIPSKSLMLSFSALFIVIIAFSLLIPQLSLLLAQAVAPLMRRGFGELGNLSARGVVATFSRTGVAVTALSVAIATTIGVTVMISGFRQSVEDWLDNTLRADAFIRPAGEVGELGRGSLSPKWIERFSSLPEVDTVSVTRNVQVQSSKGVTRLFAYEIPEQRFDIFTLRQGNIADARAAYYHDNGVLISEAYAFRYDLKLGDNLALITERGPKQFPIAGVYVDYGNEQGVVAINRITYQHYWNDEHVNSLGIYAKEGVQRDDLMRALRAEVDRQLANPLNNNAEQDLLLQSSEAIKQASISVFNRTFAVTHVLRILAITVAFVGVLTALLAILIERSRELALLRALGLTPRQLWWVVSGETGIIGAIAGIMAVPLGLILAGILIFVINRRSFGWTMEFNVEAFVVVQAVVLGTTAAIIAGVLPAIRMSRVDPAIALREE